MRLILLFSYMNSSFFTFQFFRTECNCSLSRWMSSFNHGLDLGKGFCGGMKLSAASFSRTFLSMTAISMLCTLGCRIMFCHSSRLFFTCSMRYSWNPVYSAFCWLYLFVVGVGMNSSWSEMISNLSISWSNPVEGPLSTAQLHTIVLRSGVVKARSMIEVSFSAV